MKGILMTMLGIVMMYSTMAQQIVGVEYYFDTDPGVGLGTYVSATSSGDDVTFDLNLNVNTLSLGYHNLGVRVKDANGNYSFGETRRLYIMELTTPTASSLVGGYEYFIDSDPGPGNGTYTALSGSSEQDKTIAVPISNLSAGYHYLGIRFKDVADNWSTNEFRKFYIIPSPSNLPSAKISKIEYFFDTDPGVGNGIVAATNLNADEIDETIAIDLTGKAVGDYTINVRVIDSQGVGSIYYQGEFEIRAVSTDATLSQITIDNESLSAFDAGTLSYDVSLPFGTTEINLGATSTEANANISGVGTIDVSSGSATVDVVVTAEDQTTTKTYTINFTVEKNTDATLSAISLNVGVLSPSFDAQTLSYSVSLPEGTEAVQLGATSTDDNATITGLGSIDVSSGSATVDVVVTAEDQTTTKTYTVSFYVLDLSLVSNGLVAYYPFNGNANDASGNGNHGVVNGGATLTDDRFGNANSAYSFDGNDDWINCGNNSSLNNTVQTISVWYNARTYNSNTVIARWQSFHEHVYSNQISCRYYAPSEIRFSAAISTPLNSWIHFVWVIDETSVSIYKNGDLVNSFGKSGELSFNANNILSIGCLYGWSGNTPTYLFDGLIDDVRIYNRALSQNEIETLYNLNPSTLSSNDASLSAITLDIGILNPVFSATTLSYDVTLPYGTTSVELGATTTDPNASEITGTGSIAITHGETKSVDIVVTAEDGTTQQTYTINFTTEPNDDASLSAITLDIGTLDPVFDPETLSYTVSVPNGTQSINVTGTTNDPDANVTGAGVLDLSTGSGTATLSVTAEDKSTTLDYVVDVTVENFGDPYLLHAYTFETNEADEVGNADGVLSGASSVSDGKLNLSGGHLLLPADIIDIPSKNEVSFEIVFSQAAGLEGFYTLLAFGNYGELGTDYFQLQPVRGFDNGLRSAISCNNTFDPFLTETAVDLADGKITDTAWHHIVVTISSSSMEMYFDGVSAGTASLSGDNVLSNISNSFASIGLATYQLDPVWQGSVEEFNIYNGTLDADFVSKRSTHFIEPGSDASLSAITLDIGTLDPVFDPETLSYTVSVPNGTQSINVAGITNDPDANVTGAGVLDLSTGSGTATLSVTAEDKSTTLDYVVDVTVENFGDPYLLHAYTFETNEADEVGNADGVLSGASSVSDGKLNLSGGHLLLPADIIDIPSKNEVSFEIVFSQANGLQGYYSLLAFGNYGELGTDYFQLQPVRGFDNGLLSAISCNNTIDPFLTETYVYLADGKITDTAWHHIVVTISSSSMEMYLDGVSAGTASLSGDNVLSNISNSFASIGLATYQLDPVWQGSVEEFNIYNGTLDADFVSTRATQFNVSSNDASLSAITLDIGTLNPAFDSETLSYTVSVPNGTQSIDIAASVNNPNADVTGAGVLDLSTGSGTATLSVTAVDKSTTLEYVVDVTVENFGDPYLLHAYTFETNEADEVGNADGVLSGASSVSDGKLNLSGGHLLLPADIIDIPSKNEVSFEIVFSQANGLQGFYSLLAFGNYGELGTDYFQVQPVRSFDNLLRAAISCNNTVDPYLTETVVDLRDGIITDTEWHHIVVTISSSSMEMYLDGVSVGTASLSGDNVLANVSNSFASIGLATYQLDPVWQGSVEEFNIYNGTLEADFVSKRSTHFIEPGSDASLSAITLDIGTLNPAFDSETFAYDVLLPFGTTSVNLGATATDDNATDVSGIGSITITPGETTSVDIVVTAEDGETQVTYQINFTTDKIRWNGTSWNNSTGPSETEDAIIAGDFIGGLTSANLEIKAGATVTVTGTLDIHGDLINEGEIIVESGSTLLTYAGNQVTGSITIRRNTRYAGGRYSFVGSPVQQSTAITGQTLGPIVYQYNEAAAFGSDGLARWQDASDSELMPGKGYAQANQKIVEFSGVPNSGAITYTGTYTSDTDDANEGWNLVSNPYAAAINTSSFLTENVNNTTGALYLWDDNGSDTGRGSNDDYITVNASGATDNNPANGNNSGRYNFHVGSAQGFFVKLDETSNKQVVFTESMRVTGNNADDHFFRIAEDIQRVRINLVNEDGLFKQTLIAWNNEVDDEQISKLYDAQIFNQNADNAIYSYKNRIPLAIQTITDQKVSMDLGFNVAEAGVYSLQADISECQRVVYLIDHQTEEIIDLTNQEYVFSALQGKINDRFELTFEKQSILSTGVTGEWEVYASDHQVHFIPAEGAIPQNFRIFSLDGKLVFEELINQKAAVYLNVPEGVYLIAYGEQSQKILLH